MKLPSWMNRANIVTTAVCVIVGYAFSVTITNIRLANAENKSEWRKDGIYLVDKTKPLPSIDIDAEGVAIIGIEPNHPLLELIHEQEVEIEQDKIERGLGYRCISCDKFNSEFVMQGDDKDGYWLTCSYCDKRQVTDAEIKATGVQIAVSMEYWNETDENGVSNVERFRRDAMSARKEKE